MNKLELEINTNLFYEELNNKCNPETLLNIARKKIILYSPLYKYKNIKDHKYVVDISFISNQVFMIFNNNQYNRFIHFLINTDNHIFSSKIIINNFFINKLINETNNNIIYKFINDLKNCYSYHTIDFILKYLLKYRIISNNFYNLFGEYEYNLHYDLMEYFYFNKKNYYFNDNFDYNNYIEFLDYYIIRNYDSYDISLLDYCLNISNIYNIKIPQNYKSYFKFASFLPLNLLKKYVKIFETNKLKFIILDNIKEKAYYEEIINTIVSDWCFYECIYYNRNILLTKCIKLVLKQYNIFPEKIKNFEIQDTYNIEDSYFKYLTKDSIDENKKDIRSLPKNIFPFCKNLFSDKKILKSILYNTDYLLNLKIKLIDKKCTKKEFPRSDLYDKYALILVYIVSLLHNKENHLIIYTLLLYIMRQTRVKIENNKIIFLPRHDDDFELNYLITEILSRVNFENYVGVEITDNFN